MTIGLGYRSPFITWKNGRRPQLEKHPWFPFQELLPLQIKNKVSTKGNRLNESICLQEMAVMFACMKDNDFKQTACTKEVEQFQHCYTTQMTKKNAIAAEIKEGKPNPYARRLSSFQLNKLLAKYPQFNEPKVKR